MNTSDEHLDHEDSQDNRQVQDALDHMRRRLEQVSYPGVAWQGPRRAVGRWRYWRPWVFGASAVAAAAVLVIGVCLHDPQRQVENAGESQGSPVRSPVKVDSVWEIPSDLGFSELATECVGDISKVKLTMPAAEVPSPRLASLQITFSIPSISIPAVAAGRSN